VSVQHSTCTAPTCALVVHDSDDPEFDYLCETTGYCEGHGWSCRWGFHDITYQQGGSCYDDDSGAMK
jgi:hypothetical protein